MSSTLKAALQLLLFSSDADREKYCLCRGIMQTRKHQRLVQNVKIISSGTEWCSINVKALDGLVKRKN